MPNRTPQREYAKTAERRREIIHAAVEVFSESGYSSGSMRDVADRVGLTLAGVLHHFPSKASLLEAVLAWRDDHTLEQLGRPTPEGADFFRALADLADRNTTVARLVQLHVMLTAEGTSPHHPTHAYCVARNQRFLATARHAFGQAQDRGELQPGVDPGAAARALVALTDGLQIQWLLNPDHTDMGNDLRQHLAPLLTVPL